MNEFLLKNQEAFIKFLKIFLIKFLYLKKKTIWKALKSHFKDFSLGLKIYHKYKNKL